MSDIIRQKIANIHPAALNAWAGEQYGSFFKFQCSLVDGTTGPKTFDLLWITQRNPRKVIEAGHVSQKKNALAQFQWKSIEEVTYRHYDEMLRHVGPAPFTQPIINTSSMEYLGCCYGANTTSGTWKQIKKNILDRLAPSSCRQLGYFGPRVQQLFLYDQNTKEVMEEVVTQEWFKDAPETLPEVVNYNNEESDTDVEESDNEESDTDESDNDESDNDVEESDNEESDTDVEESDTDVEESDNEIEDIEAQTENGYQINGFVVPNISSDECDTYYDEHKYNYYKFNSNSEVNPRPKKRSRYN